MKYIKQTRTYDCAVITIFNFHRFLNPKFSYKKLSKIRKKLKPNFKIGGCDWKNIFNYFNNYNLNYDLLLSPKIKDIKKLFLYYNRKPFLLQFRHNGGSHLINVLSIKKDYILCLNYKGNNFSKKECIRKKIDLKKLKIDCVVFFV